MYDIEEVLNQIEANEDRVSRAVIIERLVNKIIQTVKERDVQFVFENGFKALSERMKEL